MPGTLWKTGSEKTDRTNQLGGYDILKQIGYFGAKGPGMGDVMTASKGLGETSDFFHTLLSGDPTKISTLLAPQIGDIKAQSQQQKNVNSEFGNRSGGTNSANQAIDANTQGQIDRMIATLTGEAASGAISADSALGHLGDTTLAIGENAGSNLASIAGSSFQNDRKAATDTTSGGLELLALLAAGG